MLVASSLVAFLTLWDWDIKSLVSLMSMFFHSPESVSRLHPVLFLFSWFLSGF